MVHITAGRLVLKFKISWVEEHTAVVEAPSQEEAEDKFVLDFESVCSGEPGDIVWYNCEQVGGDDAPPDEEDKRQLRLV
jgi:hypothetical protein